MWDVTDCRCRIQVLRAETESGKRVYLEACPRPGAGWVAYEATVTGEPRVRWEEGAEGGRGMHSCRWYPGLPG